MRHMNTLLARLEFFEHYLTTKAKVADTIRTKEIRRTRPFPGS
jgi:hypothetical protein